MDKKNIVNLTKDKRIVQIKNSTNTICLNYLQLYDEKENEWHSIKTSGNIYALLEFYATVRSKEKRQNLIDFYEGKV